MTLRMTLTRKDEGCLYHTVPSAGRALHVKQEQRLVLEDGLWPHGAQGHWTGR